jgi:cbb3-type cytochrome oxidase subunit 3
MWRHVTKSLITIQLLICFLMWRHVAKSLITILLLICFLMWRHVTKSLITILLLICFLMWRHVTKSLITILFYISRRQLKVEFMVFNATFNNVSVISWRSVLLVEETGENHWPVQLPVQSVQIIKLWVGTRSWRGALDTTLCDKVYQWFCNRSVVFSSFLHQ